MRTILLSFKPKVFERVLSGEKIYEHRRCFPNEPIKAYLYISSPIKAIVGVMHLDNKISIATWKEKYSHDIEAVERINEYLKRYKFAMEITDFQNTNRISLEQLRKDISGFVVPQMYYYIDDSLLLDYLNENLKPEGNLIKHEFEAISSNMICVH